MAEQRAIILGTGLIGTSMGLALREQGWRVVGWDPDPLALEAAQARGGLQSGVTDRDHEINAAHLVVVAAPPSATIDLLTSLSTETLVTDVVGVKVPVLAATGHLSHFVGGHPMAGGATSGAEMASSHLFRGAAWVLVSDEAEPDDLITMSDIVTSLGAHPVIMTAAEHDKAVAKVSHLPHLVASTLVEIATDDGRAIRLAGGGFRDLTRVAGADGSWWAELLQANAGYLDEAIESLRTHLAGWRSSLAEGNVAGMAQRLEEARRERAAIGEHHVQVRVVLVDRPGELARVGHALERSGVDVRDIQLRHAEHGGGGILTISVAPRGRNTLTAALVDEGFLIEGG